jgi:hypothetical protein
MLKRFEKILAPTEAPPQSEPPATLLGFYWHFARQAKVFLTERGQRAIGAIDKLWKRIEKDALAGIDDKDRKRLRKLLRQVERNLGAAADHSDSADAEDEVPEPDNVVEIR